MLQMTSEIFLGPNRIVTRIESGVSRRCATPRSRDIFVLLLRMHGNCKLGTEARIGKRFSNLDS